MRRELGYGGKVTVVSLGTRFTRITECVTPGFSFLVLWGLRLTVYSDSVDCLRLYE